MDKLKQILEELYLKYNRYKFIPPDPLQFVYRYREKKDKELVAFLSSALAYGRVEQIEKTLENLFSIMAPSPYKFIVNFNEAKALKLKSFKYRFNGPEDIINLFRIFQKAMKKFDSLEQLFLSGYSDDDKDIADSLENFINSLIGFHENPPSRGLSYLLCRPSSGSPCKRLNLFLRWVIRRDNVDTGLWTGIDKAKLIIPVDVHIARLTRILKMHTYKNMSLTSARAITAAFARLNSCDPVKYDFALSRIGILEHCTGKLKNSCKHCQLYTYCRTNDK